MNRYGRGGSKIGGGGGPSKATPSTLCQKCLKKDKSIHPVSRLSVADHHLRHYSYECKEPRTERPYVSRPSRTQQLLNPKLMPKLMSDEPKDLLRKKGVADEELAKKEAERSRIGDQDLELEDAQSRDVNNKRQRSASITSSASTRSISSYSTNSRSRSPPTRHDRSSQPISRNNYQKSPTMGSERKRRRASSSSEEEDHHKRRDSDDFERRTRRRFSDASPEQRGRRRSVGPKGGSARIDSRSPIRGGSARYRRSLEQESFEHEHQGETDTTDRHQEKKFSNSQTARVTRDERGRRLSNDDERYGTTYRTNDDHRRSASPPSRSTQPPKERSLSPFSKRMALTRAMAGGR